MKIRKKIFYGYILFLLTATILYADKQGELLVFDDKSFLDFQVTEQLKRSSSDSILYRSPRSEKSKSPFNRILLHGMLSDTNLVLQISYEKDNGDWSNWKNAYMRIFENGRFWARLDIESEVTHRIQYRFIDRQVEAPANIKIYEIEGIKRGEEKYNFIESEEIPPKTRFVLIDSIPQPPIVSREDWGANSPIGDYVPHSPYRLTQHHTAGQRVSTFEDGVAEMRFIQDFHQFGRGWRDIGYHFCVDDSGRIYRGVPTEFRGTHVGGNNTGNIGASYMGNFELSGEYPTIEALQSLVDLWSWLSFEYGINPDSLLGHRDYSATACPGAHLYAELAELRNGLRKKLGFGAPYVANPLPQPFSTEVSRNTNLQFYIRDDVDGVDKNSIIVKVNGDTITPQIFGSPEEYLIGYEPDQPFPYSQNVIVDVEAFDLASQPNKMNYRYQFKIKVEALHVEIETATTMRNANLQIEGSWQVDSDDVSLPGLFGGARLIARDEDSSHTARIYPTVSETGDYNILFATTGGFLGESAHYRFANKQGFEYPHFIEYNSIFSFDWGVLSPTPIQLSSDSSSNGYIELSGLAGIETRMVLDALRLEKVDKLDAPTAPTLKWVKVINPATKEIEIAWYPTLEGDIAGYRLFASSDGLVWNEPLIDEATLSEDVHQYRFNYDGTDTTVYFRVVAVDTNKFVDELGNEIPFTSSPSDAYGVGFRGDRKILIVDNFDRMASWKKEHHPFVASYGEAIHASGQGFESCTETAVQNGEIDLNNYEIVIYFCGDDSRADESLAAVDQFRLINYMESGGKLFVSGSEIGYDFAATTSEELARYQYLLKAQYAGDLAGSNHVIGESGTVFDGLDFNYGTKTGPNLYIEDFPDYLQTQFGSQVALFYDNLRIAGIQYTGPYGNSQEIAQLVYLGFTFETITTPENRFKLMNRILTYFDVPVGIADKTTELPISFDLSQNYPNPFNPSTTINFAIPQHLNNTSVKLKIFNLLGQKIKTLVDKNLSAGRYSEQWDGKNDAGVAVASGVYVYRLLAEDFVRTRKMLLLR